MILFPFLQEMLIAEVVSTKTKEASIDIVVRKWRF